jgi:hypothetical protein
MNLIEIKKLKLVFFITMYLFFQNFVPLVGNIPYNINL